MASATLRATSKQRATSLLRATNKQRARPNTARDQQTAREEARRRASILRRNYYFFVFPRRPCPTSLLPRSSLSGSLCCEVLVLCFYSMDNSTIEKFICEMSKREPLWNRQNVRYHDRNLHDKLWREITTTLSISTYSAKGKWKNLRDNYRRELKKIQTPRSGDAGASVYENTSSWRFFKMMEFLKDQMMPGTTVSNLKLADKTVSNLKLADKTVSNLELPAKTVSNLELPAKTVSNLELPAKTVSNLELPAKTVSNLELPAKTFSNLELPAKTVSILELSAKTVSILQLPAKMVSNLEFKQSAEGASGDVTLDALCETATCPEPQPKKMKMSNELKKQLISIEKFEVSNAFKDNADEELDFFKSLIPYIKNLNPIKKLMVRQDIQTVVLKALHENKKNS
ncbi:uncharacterized protein LOC142467478 [Ascaphus truei]|uniref:uncharacterized protein LOC142467478 n=1 Tax=Ascaphus truei TaxID=8439 RepID=UPI003F59D9C2